MATFIYKARDGSGVLITGSLETDNKESLEASLDRMGLIPITITPKKDASFNIGVNRFFEKITPEDLILFTRQLATLYRAGLPLTRGLETIQGQISNDKLKGVIGEVVIDIKEGNSFAYALGRHPKVFSELYVSMIEAAETAGILDEILDRLASMAEKDAENKARVKAALLYPKIVVVAILVAVVVLMTFVMPSFVNLYGAFNVTLPLPTRLLIAISKFFTVYWYIILVIIAAPVLFVRWWLKTERGEYSWDKWKLKLPIFGPIMLKTTLSRFARVLGALFRSGIPVLQALDIVSRAVDNKLVARAVRDIAYDVKEGKRLSEPMADVEASPGLFPPMVIQMVAVGEDVGALDEMLERSSDYLDEEVNYSIRNLTTVIEPVLLVVIFGMVLFLALAIFLPIWDLVNLTKRG
ncbi:MAG: type II secretion system F family protein [Thermodesulfobacteriota bacterium]